MTQRSNGNWARLLSGAGAVLVFIGTMVYYLADIHANVKNNTEELLLRRTNVYSIPLVNEKLDRIPAIERDVAAIKLSLVRIETQLGISRSDTPRGRYSRYGRVPSSMGLR